MGRDGKARLEAVKKVLSGESTVREVASAFDVTPRTIRNWRARFLEGGVANLEDKSSAPRRVANRLDEDIVHLVVREKRTHPEMGVRRITGRLQEIHGVRIGFKSVHRILRRNGLMTASEPRPLATHRLAIGGDEPDGAGTGARRFRGRDLHA